MNATNVRFHEWQGTGYATKENAMKKAEQVLSKFDRPITYIISITDKGRFVPVAIHYPHEYAGMIAQMGVCVV